MPAQTTLDGAIDASVTTMTVDDVRGFALATEADDLVLVDDEAILVAGGLGSATWSSLTRGYGGTTAAAHDDGATVLRIARGWTSLLDVKEWTEIPAGDTDDDVELLMAIEATNAYITLCVGRFLGPSTATSRTMRRIAPDEDGRVLWIPGGIRSFTTLELRRRSTDAWETVTAGDVVLGPPEEELRAGQPYSWLEFIDDPAGSWRGFPAGGELRVTGAELGYASPDPAGAQIARTTVTRMWQAREEGALSNPTPSKFVYQDDLDVLRALGMEHTAGVG